MSLIPQQIPKIGLVMESVTVIRWLKQVGDSVTAGEPLLEVESEKSVVEIEAAANGRLAQILIEADGTASVGDQVGWIESDEITSATTSVTAPRVEKTVALPVATAPTVETSARQDSARQRSTPVARRLAAEHGIDLSSIAGTGEGGRVQLDDVQRIVAARARATTDGTPLSTMRRALGRAMSLSHATIPPFTVGGTVDWTVLLTARKTLLAELPQGAPAPSINDFLLKAIALSLLKFPALNATFRSDIGSQEGTIVSAQGAHIGLVTALDEGLLVPVMHGIENLGLIEIARLREEAVTRARSGRLRSDDLEGATISISNLGARGPERFTAMINPPQAAILAVGRRRDAAVVRAGSVVVRTVSELNLTVDHRVADGRLASQFLAHVIGILESSDWRA